MVLEINILSIILKYAPKGLIVVFEKTLEFIEKASVEELQAELEKYGIEFIPNPAKRFKGFSCPSRFSFSSAELVFTLHEDLSWLSFSKELLRLPGYQVEVKEEMVHFPGKDAA